jgi:hypothetical protein
MQIKRSELRSVIKEQVAAFFVTPQPIGMVSRSNNLESSLIKFGTKDVNEKELDKVISQTMSELEEEASKRMRSSKLKEAKNKPAKWHEAIKRPVKVGDTVHVGHAQKGGAGVEGKVTKITGNVVYIKNDAGKTYKGPLKNTAIMEISGVDSLKPNDPHTPEDEAEKDAADDVMEASPKKKGGRPRGASHIENVRFWDMSEIQLKYIIKDASQAVAAHPTARKAGKWADEVNDAVTVLYWRKKKGIKEEYIQLVVTEGFKEGTNISKLLKKSSTIKMANPGRAKGIFVIASRFGSKGITSAGEQDKVSMAVVDKAGKVLKDMGSHVNAKSALKFAKSRGYTKKIDESFNTAPAGQGKEHASVIGTDDNETNEIGSLASSPKSKAIIKKMHDLVTKKLKFKTVEDIQPIQGGVAFIFGDKAEASKMANYLKKKDALGKVIPLARGGEKGKYRASNSGERTMVSLKLGPA